jgi:hypothetical protein
MNTKKKAKSRSGPNLSDERRAELGYETLFLRPAEGTKARLELLAERLGMSKAEALAHAIELALKVS